MSRYIFYFFIYGGGGGGCKILTSGQPHGRITYRRRPSPTTNVRGTFFFLFLFFFGGGGVLDFDVWSTAWQNHLQTTPTLAKTPSTGLRHPSTTAVFSYAIGSRKLSANEQFFFFVFFFGGGGGVGAQIVGLLQTTQIKQGVSFIAVNTVYTSTNKTTIV